MTLRRTGVEKLRDAKRGAAPGVPQEFTFEGVLKLLLDPHRPSEERRINPTQKEVIYSRDIVKAYMGPAGVAKTSTICASGLMRALFQPGSKGMVGRHDYNDLTDTTALRMQEMLEALPKGVLLDRNKSAPMKWWIKPVDYRDPETDEILDAPSQITFMGLKDSLGSYEFDWEIVDEADQVEEKRAYELTTRLRAPAGKRFGYSCIFSFNPPDKEHWLYTACTGRDGRDRLVRDPWIKLFTPRPDENSHNLREGYHEELEKTLPADMVERLVRGNWGGTFPGRPVYPEFKLGLHTTFLENTYDPYSTLYRFWDFGYRHPICLFAQVTHRGILKIFHETVLEQLEIKPFARRVKQETAEKFPQAKHIVDFGDPAARQKKDTGSTLTDLQAEGVTMSYVLVDFDKSIRLVRETFTLLIDTEPAIQIDSRNCPVLVAALRGGYHMDERTGTVPVKDGYYDNVADALRYGVNNIFQNRNVNVEALPTSMRHQARGYRR